MKIFTILARFYRKFRDECKFAMLDRFCKSYEKNSLTQEIHIKGIKPTEELRYTVGEDGEPVWLKPTDVGDAPPDKEEKV